MGSPFTFYPDCENALNLLTDCDQLCHVIHILYLDRIKQEKYSVPPFFQQHVQDTSCHFGRAAKLECSVTGVPDPEVEWFKDEEDEKIEQRLGKYDVTKKDGHVTLLVYDVGPDDIGSYTCKIYNVLGESRSTGRIFFTPNTGPPPILANDVTRLIIEEKLRIVERISKERYDKSLTSKSPHESKERIRLQYALPQHSHVEDMSVVSETHHIRSDRQDERKDDDVNLSSMSRNATPTPSSVEACSREIPSPTNSFEDCGEFPTSPMSTTESVFEEQLDDVSTSDGSDQDLSDRIRWIEHGASSESDFRRGSIPYPMSLLPLRSISLDSGRSLSSAGLEEAKLNSISSKKSSDDVEEKMLKLTGLEMSPSIPPPSRSFSSGSQSSGVGSGMIVRVVRALSQNEYFDSFFDKSSEEKTDDTFDNDSICKLLALQPTLRESVDEDCEANNNQNHPEISSTDSVQDHERPVACSSVSQTKREFLSDRDKTEKSHNRRSVSENILSDGLSCSEKSPNNAVESVSEILERGEKMQRFREVCKSFDDTGNDFVEPESIAVVQEQEERSSESRNPKESIPSLKKLCQGVIMKHADKKSLYIVEESSRNMNELIRNLLEFSDQRLGFRPKTPTESKPEVIDESCDEKTVSCENEVTSLVLDKFIESDTFVKTPADKASPNSLGTPTAFPHKIVKAKQDKKLDDLYEVKDMLGSGRFGKVSLVVEKNGGGKFAAKQCACRRPSQRKEFDLEIDIMNDLAHPKLLQLYDVIYGKNDVTFVLELVTGGELFDRVCDESFDLTEQLAVKYIGQICEAISYMHALNVLHLDLKPENILCVSPTRIDMIKIIDFGFARRYEAHKPLRIMFGTPEFVAPEVVNFDPLGKGTDIWSIGVITYVLLSGLSPFMGENEQETLSNVTEGDVDFDDDSFDEISTEAKDFITTLLQRQERARPSCDSCLKHIWLKKASEESHRKSLCVAVSNLKKFVARRKWIRSINAVRAVTKLQAGLRKGGASHDPQPVTDAMKKLAT